MSNPTVSGIVHLVEETKTYGQKGFRKRMVVLEQDNGRFSAYIPIEFIQDSCDTVDELHAGQEVEISYSLTGRKWQRDPGSEVKFFLSAEGNSFRILSEGSGSAPDVDAANDAFAQAASDDEDVPF